MAQQIKFGDKLLLKGETLILDNGASHGELKSKNGTLWIKGDLIIDGTTTTVNTAELTVDDKNIELGSIASPSDSLADGGGITLKGDSDKTILWVNSTDSWDFNQKVKSTNGFEGDLIGDSTGTHNGAVIGNVTGTIGATTPHTGAFTTISGTLTGTVSSIANHDTDDLAEGSTNLYYTQARVDARYATLHNNADAGTLDGLDSLHFLNYNNLTNTPTAGSGLTLVGTVFSNTAPDQTVALTGTGATTITGTYPNFTINSTDTATDLTGTIIPATDNTYDLGSSAKKYANIYGHSVSATFADLAERYATDVPYECGTVVVFGGEAEITTTREPGDVSVAGVISTNPAIRLNTEAGNSETHPYVALRGRVPCKMIGPVSKGDLIVTADNEPGYAQSIGKENAGRSVFAKSIQTDLTVGKKVIEVSIL